MIDNVILLITGTLHERDTHELLERCHPLGVFDTMPALCVATNVDELYQSVLVETPLGTFSPVLLREPMRCTPVPNNSHTFRTSVLSIHPTSKNGLRNCLSWTSVSGALNPNKVCERMGVPSPYNPFLANSFCTSFSGQRLLFPSNVHRTRQVVTPRLIQRCSRGIPRRCDPKWRFIDRLRNSTYLEPPASWRCMACLTYTS